MLNPVCAFCDVKQKDAPLLVENPARNVWVCEPCARAIVHRCGEHRKKINESVREAKKKFLADMRDLQSSMSVVDY